MPPLPKPLEELLHSDFELDLGVEHRRDDAPKELLIGETASFDYIIGPGDNGRVRFRYGANYYRANKRENSVVEILSQEQSGVIRVLLSTRGEGRTYFEIHESSQTLPQGITYQKISVAVYNKGVKDFHRELLGIRKMEKARSA